jgi:hypothetical protein
LIPWNVYKMAYTPGDFSFIKDTWSREMLTDAYKAVSVTESWTIMAQDPGSGGFMFSTNPQYKAIGNAMKYDGHSGASYGLTMRQMQRIATVGWTIYVNDSINDNN